MTDLVEHRFAALGKRPPNGSDHHIVDHRDIKLMLDEIERLRAENAELRDYLVASSLSPEAVNAWLRPFITPPTETTDD